MAKYLLLVMSMMLFQSLIGVYIPKTLFHYLNYLSMINLLLLNKSVNLLLLGLLALLVYLHWKNKRLYYLAAFHSGTVLHMTFHQNKASWKDKHILLKHLVLILPSNHFYNCHLDPLQIH